MTPTRETFGNIPTSSEVAFYVLAAVAMAVFSWGVWRRFQLWRQGRPIHARELLAGNLRQILAKLKPGAHRVIFEGFGQGRVRGRGLPSWAHGLLVFGFLMLLLGTTLLEIDHLAAMVSDKLHFHHGIYYVIYEFTLDAFGLLFLAGCTLFFWRRLRRPASVGHRATDWYVLISFVAIGVTGYAVEGLRIAWQKPEGIGASCSPVGWLIASGLTGAGESVVRPTHLAVWWVHALLVFGFIASVPYTRLLHTIAGPLNLFLAQPSLGVMQPISLEQFEQEERMGVSDIRHLNRQQLLSLDACMECGRCEESCPAWTTGKPLSPRKVVQDLKGIMNNLRVATTGEAARTGVHEVVTAEVLWSCTACSACVWVCPVRIDPLTLILDMRRHLVAEGGLSGTAATALRRMQSSSNPWGLPQSDRATWVGSLNAPSSGGQNAS
jgi:heterodisulfide reductase subunit C/nitrate reductase gamma subunit